MIATVLVLGSVSIAAATDLLRHKIHNWNTYSGILAAWILNGVGSVLQWLNLGSKNLDRVVGWIGISDSLWGTFVCGFVLLVCYVLFRVGGGDVKLMAMLGAFLGVAVGVEVMLWTFVLGGCTGLVVLIWRVGLWKMITGAFRQLFWTLRLGTWAPLSEGERRQLQPPLFLAPHALIAIVIVRFSILDRLLG